jgi:hypothetical protein
MRRYPGYPDEVNDLLDFARHARKMERLYPEDVNSSDVMQHVANMAADWGWTFLDLVLDHEEWQVQFVAKWHKWRKQRSSSPKVSCSVAEGDR